MNFHHLTEDEFEIVRLSRAGETDASIARALGWSRSRIQDRKALLRRDGVLPAKKPAKAPEPEIDVNADFIAALAKTERHPAEQDVRPSRGVRVTHAPAMASCVGSPAAVCAES